MKFSNDIIQFAGNDVNAYEKFADYYRHFSAETLKKNIGSYDTAISLAEKDAKMNDVLFAEIERISGQARPANIPNEVWATNPNFKWATFAVVTAMIECILPQTLIDSIGLYTDMRFANYGDVTLFEVPARSLFTVSEIGNSNRKTFVQKQFDANHTIAVKNHMITSQVDMYSVLAGRQSLAKFAQRAVLSIETAMSKEAYTAVSTGLKASGTPAALCYSGAFDMEKLIKMGQTVQAYNFGAKPIFVGTTVALMNVLPDEAAGYRLNASADGASIGLIKNIYGFDFMCLPQVATGNYSDYSLALDDTQIMVISPTSDKLVRAVVEGSTLTSTNEFQQTANLVSNFSINKRYGFEFISGAVGGSYTITG